MHNNFFSRTYMIELSTYFRSSASYRVRIGLNIKRIPYTCHGVDLKIDAHRTPDFLKNNPQGLLPFLKDGNVGISQSLAILDYLEEIYSHPSFYPVDPLLKYRCKSLAQFIACEMHPLGNLRVMRYLTDTLKVQDDAKSAWYHHWTGEGFEVLEAELARFDTPYALSSTPTLVDMCLIPQIYNALRFKVPMESYPRLVHIYRHCLEQPIFMNASPEMQDDCDL